MFLFWIFNRIIRMTKFSTFSTLFLSWKILNFFFCCQSTDCFKNTGFVIFGIRSPFPLPHEWNVSHFHVHTQRQYNITQNIWTTEHIPSHILSPVRNSIQIFLFEITVIITMFALVCMCLCNHHTVSCESLANKHTLTLTYAHTDVTRALCLRCRVCECVRVFCGRFH